MALHFDESLVRVLEDFLWGSSQIRTGSRRCIGVLARYNTAPPRHLAKVKRRNRLRDNGLVHKCRNGVWVRKLLESLRDEGSASGACVEACASPTAPMPVGTAPPTQPPADTALPPASHDRASPPEAPTVGGCSPEGMAESSPPYLAAGVLPFCILGGDLLFLLGQQLRFRSRAKGANTSFPKTTGASTRAAAAGDANSKGEHGNGAGGAAVKSPSCVSLQQSSLVTPPVRRPRRSPRPKLSIPCASLAAAEPPIPTRVSETVDEGASETPASARKIPPQLENRASVAPLGSEGVGSSVGAAEMAAAAAAQRDESGATAPDGAAPPNKGSSRPGTVSRGINLQDGDSNNTAMHDSPPAAATAGAATAGADCGRRPSQSSEAPGDAPGQDTVPAGLLWSDFGGGREAGEDAEETASREFAEESFGMFHGIRLESDSVARSQATMSSALRDASLRGKRVFECRNGGYVMFIAEVNFVPDLMMNLARKEIVDGGSSESDAGDSAGGSRAHEQDQHAEWASSPGFSEKTDFAWVPASVLLATMHESRNRSSRKVVVKLGGCRYLRLFHKFVISLWGLDLAAVIKAASAPLHVRRPSIPRILLLQRDQSRGVDPAARQSSSGRGGKSSGGGGGGGGGKSAIRGIDCVRPSFLSGRKRTNLGIIEVRHERRAPPGRCDGGGGGGGGCGSGAGKEGDEGAEGREREASASEVSGEGSRIVGGGRKARSKRSGAACRKRRRQCKKARQLKAAAVAAAAASLSPTVVLPEGTAVGGASGQEASEGTTAGSLVAAAIKEG